MDISARIDAIAHVDPAVDAVSYRGKWSTWADLTEVGEALDSHVREAGLDEPSLRVGLVMRNRAGHIATIANTLIRNRCIEPYSSISPDAVLIEEIQRHRPPVLVADAEDWDRQGLVAKCNELGILGISIPSIAAEGRAEVRVVTHRSGDSEEGLRPGVAIWMTTSGTTGPPKRIPITYKDLSVGFDRVRNYTGGTKKAFGETRLQPGTSLIVTPLMHIAGLWGVMQFLVEGRKLTLLDRFEPHAWADLVYEHKPLISGLPPACIRMVLDADVDPAKLASLKAVSSGTAPLPPDTADAFTARFGLPVLTSYGATEFPGGLVGWTLRDYREFEGQDKRGSVGRPRPGVEIRVVDAETGELVKPLVVGAIEARTGQTAGRGVDGWVRTTDLGKMDSDGFLWITGRADGAINRGGFKIVPEIIEDVLLQHPRVRGASAIGLPDERLGQVPVAAVEASDELTGEELRAWCKERLLNYQVPVHIIVVPTLPRTESMKVSRPGVRKIFDELSADAPI